MALEYVPATLAHAATLAPRLRAADVREIDAAAGVDGLTGLEVSIAASEAAFAVLADGEVVAVFGVSRPSLLDPATGQIWMLASDAAALHVRSWMTDSKRWLAAFASELGFEVLVNRVDARNTVHIRWLRAMGAAVSCGVKGEAFLPFSIEASRLCASSPPPSSHTPH